MATSSPPERRLLLLAKVPAGSSCGPGRHRPLLLVYKPSLWDSAPVQGALQNHICKSLLDHEPMTEIPGMLGPLTPESTAKEHEGKKDTAMTSGDIHSSEEPRYVLRNAFPGYT